MHYLELIYLLASIASIAAMAPQIKQLLITKQSDELSLTTWITWTSYQAIALVYSISLHLMAYSIVNLAWTSFYICMLALILKYRAKTCKNTKQDLAYETVSDDIDPALKAK